LVGLFTANAALPDRIGASGLWPYQQIDRDVPPCLPITRSKETGVSHSAHSRRQQQRSFFPKSQAVGERGGGVATYRKHTF